MTEDRGMKLSPMETAPMDGRTYVLLGAPDASCPLVIGKWDSHHERWLAPKLWDEPLHGVATLAPTGWAPLPKVER
jgi:hypothetical protein